MKRDDDYTGVGMSHGLKGRRGGRTLLLCVLCLAGVSSAATDETSRYFSISVGHVAVLDDDIEDPVVLKLEFRFRPQAHWWQLAPTIGVARSGNDASYLFAVVERDFALDERWIVAPSFGLGTFDDGRDVKLGHELEFRSGINLSLRFDNDIRLGVGIYHLSNGGIGDLNPGTEPVFLSVAFPFR